MLAMSAIQGGFLIVRTAGRHARDGRGVDDGGEFSGVFWLCWQDRPLIHLTVRILPV